jgi:hypothetical protein
MALGRKYPAVTSSLRGPSDRTRGWLSQMHVDPRLIAARARDVSIELTIGSAEPAAEIALALAATLLLRLDEFAPRLHIITPRERAVRLPRMADIALADALADAHTGFASLSLLETRQSREPALRLVFGGEADGLLISTAGWAIAVGSALDGSGNGIAASYAGVLAAAEALKSILTACGASTPRMRPWRGTASLWDYSLTATPGHLPVTADLGAHAWAGAGGVASAAGWALAAAGANGVTITGDGIVVDDDAIDDDATNLNRHLTAGMNDRGSGKAKLLADLLRQARLTMTALPVRWEELSEPQRLTPLAVVSVDDDAVRREIQLDMPRAIVNAGTGDHGEYQVSRHNLITGACLCCIARADKRFDSPEQALAGRMGIPLQELEPHLNSGRPLSAALLARTALTEKERTDLADIGGRDLMQHFCGSLALGNHGPAVSAPMISAAAGALLAAELVKQSAPGRIALLDGQVALANILRGPHNRWAAARLKYPECPCTDPLYRAHYLYKWLSPPRPAIHH